MSIITLTTDFGSDDHYVAAMKGVILSINPQATIVDITHTIPPQDIRAGAWTLMNAAPYFPAGTVHVCVVDPGVGSERRPIAVQRDNLLFVGPDNGVLMPTLKHLLYLTIAPQVVWLTQKKFWRKDVSHTFHGRDIFAPVAAHLSKGIPLTDLGEPIHDARLCKFSMPMEQAGSLHGEIIHIDRFGNLITNVIAWRVADGNFTIEVGDAQLGMISKTYAEAERGALMALISSSGYLEIAVREGNAAERLKAKVGDAVRIKTKGLG